MAGPGGSWRRIALGVLREPLLHFLLLAGLLYGADAAFEQRDVADAAPSEIRLTEDDLTQLVLVFQSQWRRLPTDEEFQALIESRVREEILYREALALGLDKNDTIVKRRMAQKMQFLAEDLATAREPTIDELRQWYAENSDLFAMPPRLSFRHLYFSPDSRGGQAEADAGDALAELDGQPQATPLGRSLADPFMFQDYYSELTPQVIAREFGPEFAVALAEVEPGLWTGPLRSGYGWHLVFVDQVIAGRVPGFEEVEPEAKTAWLAERKAEAWRKAYDEMRARYTVFLAVPAEEAIAEPAAQGSGAEEAAAGTTAGGSGS